MTRYVPAALMLLLVAGPAVADVSRYHVHDSVYGCVDPRATVRLSGRDGFLHQDGWSSDQRRSGRCFLLTPRLQLETIARHAGLVLLRRAPPRAGEPPLYVMAQDLRRLMPKPAPVTPDVPSGFAMATSTKPVSVMATSEAVQPAFAGMAASSVTTSAPQAATTSPVPGAAPAGPTAAAAMPSAVGNVSPVGPARPASLVPEAPRGQSEGPASEATGVSLAAGTQRDTAPVASSPAAAPTEVDATPPVAGAVPNSGAPVSGGSSSTDGATPPAITGQSDQGVVAASVAPAAWPPAKPARTSSRPGRGLLSSVLVTLLLLPFIVGAFLVARRRRHFAHVEDELPLRDQMRVPTLPVVGGAERLASPQTFRKDCADALQEAGWATRLIFPGDGSGPDIVGRRGDSVIAVRCRVSRSAITGEMVDEAAAMGARQGGSMTVLASNAPFSQRARDEAIRQRVHLLRDTDLAAFAL